MRERRERLHHPMRRRTLDDLPVVRDLDRQLSRKFLDQKIDVSVAARLEMDRARAHFSPVTIDCQRHRLSFGFGLILAVGLDANSGGRDHIGGETRCRQHERRLCRRTGIFWSRRLLSGAAEQSYRESKRECAPHRIAKSIASNPTILHHQSRVAHAIQISPSRLRSSRLDGLRMTQRNDDPKQRRVDAILRFPYYWVQGSPLPKEA